MRALFVHNSRFYVDEKERKVYNGGNLPANIWERYLHVFDEIIVVSRGRLIQEDIKGLVLTSHENVSFDLMFDIKGGKDYYTKKKIIRNHLKKNILEADAVILRLPSNFGIEASKICRKIGKPYIAEVVGNVFDALWNYGNISGKLLAPITHYQTKKAVENSEATIYVTEHFLQKHYPNKGKLTAYASNVRIEDFQNEVLEKHIDLILKNKDTFTLGLIGNLEVRYKGYETAFKALQLLKRKGRTDICLHLIGGGSPDYIMRLIQKYDLKDQVVIVGSLKSGNEVYKKLDSLDLFIHPSHTEGLPRAVIEAMGRACPILASTAGGIPELLKKQYLHKPKDFKKLASQIEFYIGNKDIRVRMSEENFNKAKEYTTDILNEKRERFWEEALKVYKDETND